MSPNVPDLKNLDLAFSHRLESSYQWATLALLFDIKVTRYRTCISDRDYFRVLPDGAMDYIGTLPVFLMVKIRGHTLR